MGKVNDRSMRNVGLGKEKKKKNELAFRFKMWVVPSRNFFKPSAKEWTTRKTTGRS